MPQNLKTGLTRSRKKKSRAAIVLCLDSLNDDWNALRGITGLLALCQETSSRVVDAQVVGEAAEMLEEKLDRLKSGLERLEKEITSC